VFHHDSVTIILALINIIVIITTIGRIYVRTGSTVMRPNNNNNPKFDTDLELCSEPELHNLILVELTPDVQHAQNHGVHQQLTTTVNTEPSLLHSVLIAAIC